MVRSLTAQYKKAYSGLSRETWLLSLIMLINRSGTMVVPFMTLYLTSPEKGYSIGQAGLIFGLFGAGAFFGAWLGGRLTDRIGFYPVQLITLTGGGILFMVLGQMESYPLIALFCFLLSFVNESFRPANSTAIAHYSAAENRTRSFALNRLAINLGWAVGGALGGFLAAIDYELLFWVDGATNLFAAMLLLLLLRQAPGKQESNRNEGEQQAPKVFHDKKYLGFILVTFLFASCFFQLFTNVPVFYKHDLLLTESEIGLLMSLNGLLIALFEMVLVYRMEGRRNAKGLIVSGIGLVGLSFLLLNLPLGGFWVGFLAILTVTMGEMLAMPFMNSYWIARTVPGNRGRYAALYTMAWSAAQVAGPLGGSQAADRLGFDPLWWIVAGTCALAAWLFARNDGRG